MIALIICYTTIFIFPQKITVRRYYSYKRLESYGINKMAMVSYSRCHFKNGRHFKTYDYRQSANEVIQYF
jgi:hypothetical protein